MRPATIESPAGDLFHQACIARVVEASDGRAIRVRCESGDQPDWPVAAHAQLLPELQPGDRVLVVMTREGVVITQMLVDHPSAMPARLTLQASHGLVIRCGSSHIELGVDGDIRLSGDMIHQQADGRLVLRGGRVELN